LHGSRYKKAARRRSLRRLAVADASSDPAIRQRAFLDREAIDAVARQLALACAPAVSLEQYDIYATALDRSGERVFRVICGDVWFDIDAASGAIRDRLDGRQRAYLLLFSALHRLDFPVLANYPTLRTCLIIGLCGFGFVFSFTAVVLAWRRVLRRLPNVPG
jgi:hypothetical protein